MIKEITACRSCGHTDLVPVLSLGEIYIVDFGEKGELKAPLDLVVCGTEGGGCGLVQLKHTVDQNLLFRHYYYKSGVNEQMREALRDIVRSAEQRVTLERGDTVLDIGASDGTLLSCYSTRPIWRVGFEPAENLVKEASRHGTIINDFFSAEKFREWRGLERRKAKVITAASMFYDLDDPNTFLEDVKKCLADDGVFIIQMNYLPAMLEKNGFDNIVHEHLEYYSVTTLLRLLNRHDLTANDVEFNEVNGGSLRAYIRHWPATMGSSTLSDALAREKSLGLDKVETYRNFANRVEEVKRSLRDFIAQHKGAVYVYGASTRGNTLLQACGLNRKVIPYAVERNPAKFGKEIVGTGITIISEEEARKNPPKYMLVLPWYFLGGFLDREKDYLLKGGRFIVPLPEPLVVSFEKI